MFILKMDSMQRHLRISTSKERRVIMYDHFSINWHLQLLEEIDELRKEYKKLQEENKKLKEEAKEQQ